MDEDVKPFIYWGSPFLPLVTKRVGQEIAQGVDHEHSVTETIAIQLLSLASLQQIIHSQTESDLKRIYELTVEDLNEYGFGFDVAPFLILLSIAKGDPQRLLPILSNTAFYQSVRTDNFNSYLEKHMYKAQALSLQYDINDAIGIAQPIYEICKQDLGSNNLYFRIGLAASENIFANCFNLYQLLINPQLKPSI
jgi:hypothetical protein